MKKALALICIILAMTALSACKSEQELKGDALRKELDEFRKARPAKDWVPPDFSKMKPAQEDGK